MTAGSMAAPSAPVVARRTLRGRLAASLLAVVAAVLQRLPDRALHLFAEAAGRLVYAVQPARRALVRANLERVCRYLAEQGSASPAVVEAARDRRALERLVRQAFGHYLRAYLEGAIVPAYDARRLRQRVIADDQALAEQVLGKPGSGERRLLLVGLHFGAIEIPARWLVLVRGMALTSPMETVADPDLQAYFERSRGATGLRVVPVRGAGRILAQRLAAGEAVAVVADRVVAGSGARVELFGAPARLPLGPAVLAVESGAPAWVVAIRRVGWGQYRARLEQIEVPAEGPRRERLAAFLVGQARAFERAVAQAPEQWWTLFFPIWEDAA